MQENLWEYVFTTQNWGKYPGEDLIRFVARNYYQTPIRKDVRIIELGCGPGANIWYLAREGFSFVGIDGSAAAITQAKARLDAECPGWQERGELIVGDISEIPFADEAFDAVIDNECIYCNSFEKSLGIYAEARRVLRSGGRIFTRSFAVGSWGDGSGEPAGRNAWYCSEGPLAGKGLARFTHVDEIPELLAGFDDIRIEVITRSEGVETIKEWIVIARKPL